MTKLRKVCDQARIRFARKLLAALLATTTFGAVADIPRSIEGLSYHDVVIGTGPVVRPGNTVEILIKQFDFVPGMHQARGRFIDESPPTMVVAGHAALGDWDHYSWELGIIGMKVGGTRLIYAPGLFADSDVNGKRLGKPHVVAVQVVEMDNDYYKKNKTEKK